ncbi:hypothetical protein F7725_020421, partial [Dissostichus mawsoni]
MEAKLRVLIDDRIEKLVLPAGIPPTVEELTNVVKETYAVIDEFSLQYLDSDFEDYFTLNQTDQIKHKDTVKIQDEFHRITMVHLESKFMSKLDEYTPGLLKLFHSKGGTMGLKLKALLLQTPSNPNINITRDVVIRCLMVYLGEHTDQLLKKYD